MTMINTNSNVWVASYDTMYRKSQNISPQLLLVQLNQTLMHKEKWRNLSNSSWNQFTALNRFMSSCRSLPETPLEDDISQRHSAWAIWKWHNSCRAVGKILARAIFSAFESSVMNSSGVWTTALTAMFLIEIERQRTTPRKVEAK